MTMVSDQPVRIAFVDDDENLLSSHRRNFARLAPHWQGLYFNNPQTALAEISGDPDVTAAILDIHMPIMTGLELAAKLRNLRSDLIIVMLTGYADLQSALTAVNEFGVFRFYPNPTALKTVLEGIETEIARKRGESRDTIPAAFLDLFHLGLIATDDRLAISHMNAQAAEMLRRSPAMQVNPENRLLIDNAPDDLDRFLHPPAGRVPAMQRGFSLDHEQGALSVFLRRVRNGADKKDSFVFILVEPERMGPPTIDDLIDVFGLTRSEAKLTQKLAEGMSLDQAADLVGISLSSARTYLKTVFSKIGVNRQPQLMKTVLSTIPALRR